VLSFASVMLLMHSVARSRSLVGTRGFGADRMFAELRDRIALVGRVPALPDGWRAWSCILSAHGDRFSGDFVVVHLSPSGHRLEILLVDVSGKGTRAGTRSLLLSGALGGLLGAVPSGDFLRAANEYLVRQGWEEGFATAVHLDLDLRTGHYSIGNAGHPSPARYTSGRARWTVLDGARGPLLGVVPGAVFPRQSGRLDRGDALLFYSDGVIEARGRDLTDGIDRMLGVAAMSVLGEGDVAREVCESARSGEDDDRAALAVRRL
jgi:serine phosphatase RsbU (regulator of sigma subunit)